MRTPLGIVHDGLVKWNHDGDAYCLHTYKRLDTNTWSYDLLRRKRMVGDWEPVSNGHGFQGSDVADTGIDRDVGHGFMGAIAAMDYSTGLAVRRASGIDYCALG